MNAGGIFSLILFGKIILKYLSLRQGSFVALEPYHFEKEDRSSGIMLAINKFSYYCRKYPGFALFKKKL